ncbi:type IV pilus modification PilV family protein [Tundrisphaera sp. TA3]|uniref:type IV pilus modification PilV family protein n=1 Tax=Tundrisphaera sp. TA3 TaxID=3435775 RepID=UPI003EBAC8AC
MIARAARSTRSGITLTEILIAIMIMGVGLISLATLFPLGLLRMREATRFGRTALLFENAADEMDARSLLTTSSFIQTWYGPRNPFIQDSLRDGTPSALYAPDLNMASGLPFAYDPAWRAMTGVMPVNPSNALYDSSLDYKPAYANGAHEARFGAAVIEDVAFNIREDPDGSTASGHGLQRLTNFIPYSATGYTPLYPFTHQNINLGAAAQRPDGAADIFFAGDDIVFNAKDGQYIENATTKQVAQPSPLLPDLTTSPGSMIADYRFSWFFTGRQVDVINSSQFVGDIVVCDSRPFGFDTVTINGQSARIPAGETTVEAIFGFGRNFVTGKAADTNQFARGSDRMVLLRWKVGVPDPEVRPGGWIADVTYERNLTLYGTRSNSGVIPYARCHWYQVNKRTEAETETDNSAGPHSAGNYRRMIVTLNTNVKQKTLLKASSAEPVHLNFALVMPSVINVFPRAFEVH